MLAYVPRSSVIEDKQLANDGRTRRVCERVEKIVMIIVCGIVPIARSHIGIMVDLNVGHYLGSRVIGSQFDRLISKGEMISGDHQVVLTTLKPVFNAHI